MTGIERLRKLSNDMLSLSLWVRFTTGTEKDWDCYQGDGRTVNNELLSIADQIERESDVETVRSDAMRAWEWVREHGGLDAVRRALQDAENQRAELCSALGIDAETGWSDAMAEMRQRLIPEGCEWPRYESGEPVRIGSVAEFGSDDSMTVMGVELTDGGFVLHGRNGGIERPCQVGYKLGVRVRRPSVLAADGEPLEVGQTVYNVEDGAEYKVCKMGLPRVTVEYWCEGIAAHSSIIPSLLTHQRPVMDADGVPIKAGDTVYLLPGEWCDKFPCHGFHGGEELEVFADGEASHVPGGVQCREKEKRLGFRGTCYPKPSQLTHTKPEIDSWERIDEDAGKDRCSYFGAKYQDCGRCTQLATSCSISKCRDLVRRCRALAERERGE